MAEPPVDPQAQATTAPSEAESKPPAKPPTPPSSDSSFDSVISMAAQQFKDTSDLEADVKASNKVIQADYDKVLARPRPEQPVLEKPEKPPKFQGTDALHAFGSIASMVAIFGSLLTRAPLTSALNASAAAMQGIRKGDIEKFDHAMTEWKAHVDYANKVNDWQLQKYQMAMDLYKDDSAMLLQHMKIIGEQTQNQMMLHAAKSQDISAISKVLSDQRSWSLQLKDYSLKVSEFAERKRENAQAVQRAKYSMSYQEGEAVEDLVKAGSPRADAIAKVKSAAQGGGLTTEAKQNIVERLEAGDKSALQNVGRGAQGTREIVEIQNMLASDMKAKGMSGSDIAAKMVEFTGFASESRALGTRLANIEMRVNEARNMAPTLLATLDKLGPTAIPKVNQLIQYLQYNTGSPELREYGAALNSFLNAYSAAVSGGTMTVSAREHAEKMINEADNPDAVRGVIKVLDQEMDNAQKAPEQVRFSLSQEIAGKTAGPRVTSQADFDKLPPGSRYQEQSEDGVWHPMTKPQ